MKRLPNPAIKFMHGVLFRLGHDNPEVAAESFRLHWHNYARRHAATAFVRQVRSLDVRDTLKVQSALPHLSVPARVVWGAADQFQKIRYGGRFARSLGTTLRRIEGGKHFTPEDHPEMIAGSLNELLLEVEAQAG